MRTREMIVLLRALVAIAVMAWPSFAWAQAGFSWMPDIERYGFYHPAKTVGDNLAVVHGSSSAGVQAALALLDLFPQYLFDTPTNYLPGSGGPRKGFFMLVEDGELTIVVTEDAVISPKTAGMRATRAATYLVILELIRSWTRLSVHPDASVQLGWVPAFDTMKIWARAELTDSGIKVVM